MMAMISGLTPGDPALSIDMDAVMGWFKRTQVNKAPGPDNICPAQDYGPALDEFMEWCDTSCLELNVTKTK
ncbi:hypothetical protein AAFF_G00409740 [Aldrovandia affinis]|uniref:Uncharacterized protein n=1 Tax=Aldrovandia affinis TaxID=143900 RepID=A0AAD7SC32_9TELE|nr:hypothetical protein AAFF_G00409740 [Aldrovandia affinis]